MNETAYTGAVEGAKQHQPLVEMLLERKARGHVGSHDPKDDFSDRGKER